MTERSPPILAVRHRYVLQTLADDPETFHPRDVLRGIGPRTLADLAERGFIDIAGGGRRGIRVRYRITAAGLEWLNERERTRQKVQDLKTRPSPRPLPAERHPLADVVTATVARLAAERGLPVEEVARRAGLKAGALSPVPSGFSIRSLAEVATVLGVEPSDLARRS